MPVKGYELPAVSSLSFVVKSRSFTSVKLIARICLCFTSKLLFSVVVVHPRTALNAILLALRLL